MKNIHVLPKPNTNSLVKLKIFSKDKYNSSKGILPIQDEEKYINIYITSDEEIKDGDWYISILENEVYKATKETQNIMSVANLIGTTTYKNTHFKIILTTSQDLIKDGVQAINYEFLEWLVNNPSCEEVEIRKEYITPLGDIVETCYDNERLNYKIIIPKEEPKHELPEIGTKEFNDLCSHFFGGERKKEKSYSEEDMKIAFDANIKDWISFKEFIEQFKNK